MTKFLLSLMLTLVSMSAFSQTFTCEKLANDIKS